MNVDTGQITAIGRRWADLGELVVDLLAEHAAEPARAVPVPATQWAIGSKRTPAIGSKRTRTGRGGRHAAPGRPLRLIQGGRR